MEINPLENYNAFRIYNYQTLIKEWGNYLERGLELFQKYLESLLSTFNGKSVTYEEYMEKLFLPIFTITLPKGTTYEQRDTLWDKLYLMLEEFAIKNNIETVFNKINISFEYTC